MGILVGFVVGLVLGAALPTWAAWTVGNSGTVATRAGTWATCTAGSIVLPSVADGHTYNTGLKLYTGSGSTTMEVQTRSPDLGRSFVAFATPTLPAGCSMTSATLTLRETSHVGGADLALVVTRVAASWTEASPPAFGIATTGADVNLDPTAGCAPVCSRTAVVTAAVASWIATPSTNMGLRIKYATEATSGTTLRDAFGTKENTNATARPTLTVVYA